jgi:Helix-turn-helix domain
MAAYSMDLRRKILQAYERRLDSQRALANVFGVSLSFIEKVLRGYRTTGELGPKPYAGGQTLVQQMVHDYSDATLKQLCARLAETTACVSVSRPCAGWRSAWTYLAKKSLHVSGSFQAYTGHNRRRRASIIGIHLPNTSRTTSNKAAISKGLARNRTAPERTAGNS